MSSCENKGEALGAYRESVEELFRFESDLLIDNGEPAHAAVLFEQFFKHATDCVRILCKDLNEEVFCRPRVLNEAKKALSRGVSVKICTQDKVSCEGHRFINDLRSFFESGLLTCSHREGISTMPNFSTMDKRGFRFEENPNKIEAKASANSPKLTQKLIKVFEDVCCGC